MSYTLPLNHLFWKSISWNWTKERELSFYKLKPALSPESLLRNRKPILPIVAETDASNHNVNPDIIHEAQGLTQKKANEVKQKMTRSL